MRRYDFFYDIENICHRGTETRRKEIAHMVILSVAKNLALPKA
jgi:hypothetical protein